MRAMFCDRCGDNIKQAIKIQTELVFENDKCHTMQPWSNGKINGEYCQNCIDDISEFISGYRPTEEEKIL